MVNGCQLPWFEMAKVCTCRKKERLVNVVFPSKTAVISVFIFVAPEILAVLFSAEWFSCYLQDYSQLHQSAHIRGFFGQNLGPQVRSLHDRF